MSCFPGRRGGHSKDKKGGGREEEVRLWRFQLPRHWFWRECSLALCMSAMLMSSIKKITAGAGKEGSERLVTLRAQKANWLPHHLAGELHKSDVLLKTRRLKTSSLMPSRETTVAPWLAKTNQVYVSGLWLVFFFSFSWDKQSETQMRNESTRKEQMLRLHLHNCSSWCHSLGRAP